MIEKKKVETVKLTYGQMRDISWPELPDTRLIEVLFECTPYPAGSSDDIVNALKSVRKRSGGDIELAKQQCYNDMDRIMTEMKNAEN